MNQKINVHVSSYDVSKTKQNKTKTKTKQKNPIIQLSYKKNILFWFWMTMRRVVLVCRSKTRENYDAQISYFGLILIVCKYLHYFVPGNHEHSCHISVLERVRTRTRTQWVSPSPSPDSSPDSDSTLVDSDSDSDSTSVDSDSSAVDSDSGLMDSDSDSDSTQVDSDSQWVQVSPVRNVQGKFKLSRAIMDEIRGRN